MHIALPLSLVHCKVYACVASSKQDFYFGFIALILLTKKQEGFPQVAYCMKQDDVHARLYFRSIFQAQGQNMETRWAACICV